MPANFNFIAPVYDQLAFLVYGNKLTNAKKAFLDKIQPHSRMLLMGGGTGVILNHLLTVNDSVSIDFVEPSAKMIDMAKSKLRSEFRERVNFICGDHDKIPSGVQYDVVTSFFVIDCLKEQEAAQFVTDVARPLKENGAYLFADFFYTKNIFRNALIAVMYAFFKMVSGISADRLPDYEKHFHQQRLSVADEKEFAGGMIQSRIYRRSGITS